MRISDWSSDVCSSDLQAIDHRGFIDPGTASRHWSLVQSPTDRFRFLLLHPLCMFLRLPQQPKHIAAPDLLYVDVAIAGLAQVGGDAGEGGYVLDPRTAAAAVPVGEIGRAQVCTPGTNSHPVCRLLLAIKH